MPPAPSLQDLIDIVSQDAPSDDALDQLATAATAAARLSEAADGVLGHYVDRARHRGYSWTEISGALGVSRQAAHKRFADAGRAPVLERFTGRARTVLEAATEIARRLGHPYVGTEHLLLALYTDADCVAARVLTEAGLTGPAVEEAVLRHAPGRDGHPDGPLPFTPRAAAAVEATLGQALRLGHNYIGTEHLLLALYAEPTAAATSRDSAFRPGGGLAAEVLTGLGLDRDTAHARVVEKLSGLRGR
jgi:hypothetical protein